MVVYTLILPEICFTLVCAVYFAILVTSLYWFLQFSYQKYIVYIKCPVIHSGILINLNSCHLQLKITLSTPTNQLWLHFTLCKEDGRTSVHRCTFLALPLLFQLFFLTFLLCLLLPVSYQKESFFIHSPIHFFGSDSIIICPFHFIFFTAWC